MSLDYDLFVLNPENKDSTPEQIRDCIYDAIDRLAECALKLHNQLNPTKCGVGGANATKTPPPLIKDKKIRKAVRARADMNKVEKAVIQKIVTEARGFEDSWFQITGYDNNGCLWKIEIHASYLESVSKEYKENMVTIEELCGEEE